MGARYFETRVRAESAELAFKQARDEAFHDHGHSGYTGTIAEKRGFVLMVMLANESAQDAMDRMDDSDIVNDKWGPAACIEPNPGEFVFFGWASS